MLKRTVSGIILMMLLFGLVTLAFNVRLAGASETIYIRADGSIDPPTANITSVDNVTYTFTANNNDSIVMQRSNIVIDGAGYTLQGTGSETGMDITGRSNITIKNMEIKAFYYCIYLSGSSNNTLTGNNMTLIGSSGIRVGYGSSNNIIFGNIIQGSPGYCLSVYSSSNNNTISGNTFTGGNGGGILIGSSSNNIIRRNNVRNNRCGMNLIGVTNSILTNNNITNNDCGMAIEHLSSSIIFGNRIQDNGDFGLSCLYVSGNLIYGNIIANNGHLNPESGSGMCMVYSNDSTIYHNNFINNFFQVRCRYNSVNIWDNAYPSGGNYWSDYSGVDANSDGIGDTPYVIDTNNQDPYPLMNPWTPPPPWGDWNHYHNYTEIVNTLLYLNETYQNIVDVFSIGKSWLNQDIFCIRLTNESNTHPKPKLFFVGYHHAREPISAELPLYFAVEAATKFSTNETITRMLNYSEIYIVPMLNVDAFEAFKQNEWQRKNVHPFDEDSDALFDEDPPDDQDGDSYIKALVRGTPPWMGEIIGWEGIDNDGDGLSNEDWVGGVDLNRNYGYQWNATCYSGSPYTWAEDYRGPAPFSEPETQAIRDLALQHDFKYAVSFHSGSEVIGYPWGYTTDPTSDDIIFRQIASNLSALVGAPYGQSSAMYTMSGSWDDWMYANRSTFALTCEIYGNDSAWQFEPGPEPDTWWMKGVFQAFNPDPNNIETVIQRWLPVFTYTTNRAITEAYDTATTNVTPHKKVVCQGYTMNINVTVTNQGDFTETFQVTAYANTTMIETKEVTLTSESSTTVTFTWNTAGFAKGNYTISAYAWPVPGETDTADNRKEDSWVVISIYCDVNGDGIVDISDILDTALAFGATPGEPRWNPNCDLDDNGIIDISDILETALHFGET